MEGGEKRFPYEKPDVSNQNKVFEVTAISFLKSLLPLKRAQS